MDRYALVSSQDGTPARFFIFDTQEPSFLQQGGSIEQIDSGLAWLNIKDNDRIKRLGLIVRSANEPQRLIASLGLSQFFIQFNDDSSLFAVQTFNKENGRASVEIAGSAVDIDLDKEVIKSIWIKEPYTYFDGSNIDNMEKMTKLMLFSYKPHSDGGSVNNWSHAADPWQLAFR